MAFTKLNALERLKSVWFDRTQATAMVAPPASLIAIVLIVSR